MRVRGVPRLAVPCLAVPLPGVSGTVLQVESFRFVEGMAFASEEGDSGEGEGKGEERRGFHATSL